MIQSVHTDVVKYNWACQMQLPILDLQYIKAELSYDFDFLHMVRHP